MKIWDIQVKSNFSDFLKYCTIKFKDCVKLIRIMSTDLEMQRVALVSGD